jgi:DMSO/TMAO reductase YedYZ molybdopterin-dependent catalytic subunit
VQLRERLVNEEALIAYEADGEPLTPDHGRPLRAVRRPSTS